MPYLAARAASLVALAFALGACSEIGDSDSSDGGSGGEGASGDPSSGPGTPGPASGAGAGSSSGGSGSAQGGSASSAGGAGSGGSDPSVCARWQADRADMSEGSWSGSIASCDAGDVSAAGRDNALKLVNLYRFLVGMPAVTHEATRNERAQACALLVHANGQLSHNPPPSWDCYTELGADGAGSSNIASTPGVTGVDLYIADPGNDTTMGHRRWILSGGIGPIGLGSTDGYSCMQVIGGSGNTQVPFVAFPSPGVFPSGAMTASFASVDQTGWTVQSSQIDLTGASVTVTDGGQDMPVDVVHLQQGYGDTWALRFNPQGWTTQAGHTYAVSVTGGSQPIDYEVEVVDCQ
jgi:hypothetical protein